MSDVPIDAIRTRWSRYGGMGNDRNAADYTDDGCRLLVDVAFDDVNYLLARYDELRTQHEHTLNSWDNR